MITLLTALLVFGETCSSDLSTSDAETVSLLKAAFSRVPGDDPIIVQNFFRNEKQFELIVSPSIQKSSVNQWRVTALFKNKKVQTGSSIRTTTLQPAAQAFNHCVDAMVKENVLNIPCRIRWSLDGHRYFFLFSDLPLGVTSWSAVEVDSKSFKCKLTRGY